MSGQRRSLPSVLVGGRRRLYAVLVANGAAQAMVMVGVALLARLAIDHVQGTAVPTTLSLPWLVAGLGTAAVLLLGLRTAERTTAERLAQDYLTEARLRLFDHLNLVPSRVMQQRTRGVMMVRFVADLNALGRWISLGLSRLTVAATACAVALAALAVLSPDLAAGVLAVLVLPAIMVVASGPALYRRVRELRRRRGRLAANLGDKVGGRSPVAVFARTRGERERLERQSRRLGAAAVERTRLAALLRAVPDTVVPAAVAVVLVMAMVNVTGTGAAPTGSILMVVLIVNLLSSPLRDLAQVFVYRQNYRAARDVLQSFLDLPTLDAGSEPMPRRRGPGKLTFDDVGVVGSLIGVTVEASAGDRVVVSGATGSGKSTLLALAARMFDPDQGEVRLDGRPLRVLELTAFRRVVGVVDPDLPLVRGSVRRNLTYRCASAANDEISRVMALCGLEGLVAGLEKGLETRLVEGGANLSVGFRQRLMLARAVIGRPRLLLIDDADALLDGEAKAALQRVMAERTATVLIVSHDPAIIAGADALWHLAEGHLTVRDAGATEMAMSSGVVTPLRPRRAGPDPVA